MDTNAGHRNDDTRIIIARPKDKATEPDTVAGANDAPASDTMRDTIDCRIESVRNNRGFEARLSKLVEEDRRVLDRLA